MNPVATSIVSVTEPVEFAGGPIFSAGKKGVRIVATTEDGKRLFLSRYADEGREWTIDGIFLAGSSFPAFFNGHGSRAVATRQLRGTLAAEIDFLLAK